MKSVASLFLFVLFFVSIQANAQDFGDIPVEDFSLTGIDGYPELDAIVLFDKVDITFTTDFELIIKYHRRVKILTEAGKDQASINIRYWHEDKILDIDAASYSMDGKTKELDSDNIFDEGSSKFRKKVFAIPGVEVGSVIEYQYTHYSKYISNLDPQWLQGSNYVRLSEVSVLLPRGFTYNVMQKNTAFYNLEQTSEMVYDVLNSGKKLTKYTWRAHDLPPIRQEPYMRAPADYYAQILFQLVAYKDAYQSLKFAKSWGQITKNPRKFYIEFIEDDGLEDKVNELLKGKTRPMDKALTLYSYVQKNISTGDRNWFPGDDFKSPEEALKAGTGSPTEKNVLLMNMLKLAGFDPHPLLISTRGHGDFNPDWKQLEQFNRAIVHVNVDKKSYYLDMSHKYAPFGILPSFLQVGTGLLLNGDKPVVVAIKQARVKNKQEIFTKASLDKDGVLYVKSHFNYKGEEALDARSRFGDKIKRRKKLEKMLETISDKAELDTFYVHAMDSLDKPFSMDVEYHLDGFVTEESGLKFFKPPFITAMNSNKFKSQKRFFPVDFGYKNNFSEAIELTLPKGYSVELPENSIHRMRALLFAENYYQDDDVLQCKRIFKILKAEVPQKDYTKLRNAYNAIVEADQNEIALNHN